MNLQQNNTQGTAVVILSGGLDSTAALFEAIARGYEPVALSFFYGQRHAIELSHAQELTQHLGIRHELVDISSINHLITNSALTNPSIPVPEGHYAAETMKATVVPNRNAIMLSIAFGFASNIDARAVFTGVHAGDHAIYPDCRPEFVRSFGMMESLALENSPTLIAPFIFNTKAEIVERGAKLSVPFSFTYSCYNGGKTHCGRCSTCVERREAFELAGVVDPTEYIDKDFWKTVVKGE